MGSLKSILSMLSDLSSTVKHFFKPDFCVEYTVEENWFGSSLQIRAVRSVDERFCTIYAHAEAEKTITENTVLFKIKLEKPVLVFVSGQVASNSVITAELIYGIDDLSTATLTGINYNSERVVFANVPSGSQIEAIIEGVRGLSGSALAVIDTVMLKTRNRRISVWGYPILSDQSSGNWIEFSLAITPLGGF